MKTTTKPTQEISNNTGLSSLYYRIIELNPSNASKFEWGKFFEIREKLHYEHNPDDPFGDREVLRKKMSIDNPYEKVWRSLVLLNNEQDSVIGYQLFFVTTEASPEYEDNKHIAWVYVIVSGIQKKWYWYRTSMMSYSKTERIQTKYSSSLE